MIRDGWLEHAQRLAEQNKRLVSDEASTLGYSEDPSNESNKSLTELDSLVNRSPLMLGFLVALGCSIFWLLAIVVIVVIVVLIS